MKTYLILFQFMLLGTVLQAQKIVVKNTQNKQALDYALLIKPNGEMYKQTDKNGEVDLSDAQNDEYFVLQHPKIEQDTLFVNQIENGVFWVDSLIDKIDLNEAVVISKSTDFYVIEGYFYAYVLNDGEFNIYVDGIMQYVFDRKTNQYKENRLKAYRTFILEGVNEDRKEISSIVFDNFIELPHLKTIKKLNSDKSIVKTFDPQTNEMLYEVYSSILKDKEFKIFGYVFSDLQFSETYKFENENSVFPRDLVAYRNQKSLELKHKKEDSFSQILSVAYFEPLRIAYLNKKDLGEKVKFSRTKSHYTEEFWVDNSNNNLYEFLHSKFNENFKQQPLD